MSWALAVVTLDRSATAPREKRSGRCSHSTVVNLSWVRSGDVMDGSSGQQSPLRPSGVGPRGTALHRRQGAWRPVHRNDASARICMGDLKMQIAPPPKTPLAGRLRPSTCTFSAPSLVIT